MLLRPTLVGIVEIDLPAGETFLFERLRTRGFTLPAWVEERGRATPSAVLAANLPRLQEELELEFRRLQARLAA